jgi:hypothetical protein
LIEFEAKLNLSHGNPFEGKSYPIPYHKRQIVQKEIEGFVRESDYIKV